MVHHQGDILLGEPVKRSALGEEVPDKLMVPLSGTFLVWRRGVAVEQPCPAQSVFAKFNAQGVGEFTPVVGKAYLEQAGEAFPSQCPVQTVEDIRHGAGVIVFPEEGQHQLRLCKMDGEEYRAAFAPLDGIELDDGCQSDGRPSFR